MSTLTAAGFAVFILILFIGIYLSLFGLPGTILILIDVLIYAFATHFASVGWKVILFLVIFALLAEGIDILLGMTYSRKTPFIKKLLWPSAIGAILGMAILTPFLWGLGIWGGFFLGGLAGLIVMEVMRQYKMKAPRQVSYSAIFTMIGQKTLKGFFSLAMILVSLTNIYS